MKKGTNTHETILPTLSQLAQSPAATTDTSPPTLRKRQGVSTTALISQLTQTLDTQQFIDELKDLDSVTQRQCLLRALRDLAGAGAIRLHGSRSVRKVIRQLQAHQKTL